MDLGNLLQSALLQAAAAAVWDLRNGEGRKRPAKNEGGSKSVLSQLLIDKNEAPTECCCSFAVESTDLDHRLDEKVNEMMKQIRGIEILLLSSIEARHQARTNGGRVETPDLHISLTLALQKYGVYTNAPSSLMPCRVSLPVQLPSGTVPRRSTVAKGRPAV